MFRRSFGPRGVCVGSASTATLLVALAGALGGPAGTASRPASRPADPALAQAFLTTGLGLLRKGQSARAAAALRRAIANDPSLIQAHYHLAKACQDTGRTGEALTHYRRFLKLLAAQTKPDPAAAKLKADAERQLKRLDVYRKRWRVVREEFAGRFRALATKHAGKPSCVRALELAVTLTPDDAETKAELAAAKKLLPAVLGPPPTKADPEGAKLLIARARGLGKSGKKAEAAKLLRSACGLSRDAATLSSAAEAYASVGTAAEAAVAVAEALAATEKADEKVKAALRGRLLGLQRRTDPGMRQVEFLLGGFATRAERVAAAVLAGKDVETAEEILTLVLKLIPGRPSAQELMDKLTNKPPTISRLPNLASKWVKCSKANLKQGIVVRTRTMVEMKGVMTKADPYEATLTCAFTPLVWGKTMRTTWRVQQIWPSPKGKRGMMFMFCPLAGPHWAKWIRIGPKWAVSMPKAYADKVLSMKFPTGLYREDGTYEITCSKEGRTFTVLVEGKELLRIGMSEAQNRTAADMPVVLELFTVVPDGEKVHLRATLLDFSCSPDCIRRK